MGGIAVGAAVAAFQSGDETVGSGAAVTADVRALASADFGGVGGPTPTYGVLNIAKPSHDELGELRKSLRIDEQRAEAQRQAEREAEEARRPKAVFPVQGTITSNYGARWGGTHYGLDIANRIGTPIRSVADGVVVEAGPASGFGLWVRVRHDDGTTTVYGHIDSYAVRAGQRVKAGEVIAAVGNRGYSTGPHLHFEVWDPNGRKANPLAWLQERGAAVG